MNSRAEQIVQALRRHEAELRGEGLLGLALFGSAARGDTTEASDIDLAAVFDDAKELSLLDVVRLERRLAELPGRRVDLVQESRLRPRVRAHFDRDAICAF